MRYRRGRRVRQLALVMVAAPAAARRAEERDKTSPTSRRLRQGADLVQRFGRGPLANRLGRRPATTATSTAEPPPPPGSEHGG
jgi:hypothetical protein